MDFVMDKCTYLSIGPIDLEKKCASASNDQRGSCRFVTRYGGKAAEDFSCLI